jgi:predicted deacylase
MSEAGANGIIDEDSVLYHLNGILNIARYLGMLSGAPQPTKRGQHLCDRYVWVPCPVDGLFYPIVEPARHVTRGQKLGELRDIYGRRLGDLVAPETGYVLWRMTHPVLREGAFALAIAVPAAATATVAATGVAWIDVKEGGRDGHRIVLPVPLLLGQAVATAYGKPRGQG